MAKLVGYTLPMSTTGRSSLVPPPPWHFSGEVLLVEYLADPDAVSRFLPDGLEPPARPGLAAAIFGDWQSCTDGGEELLDPVRSQYHEFYIALACSWRGEPVVRCPFCWVDKDFSLVRGLIQGYPKKMGSIALTRAFDIGRATPALARGARFAGTLAAGDRRLVEAYVTLDSPAEAPDLMTAPLIHTRRFPAWNPGTAALEELVTGGSTRQQVHNVWGGSAELEFFDSPTDELALLRPVEVLRGYRLSFAETITGGRLLSSDIGDD
ncbi:acetoacetate decarboxylase family protein [Frankia sp. Cr2]|uniref:acetoacetate decarboxylase family protein n=1 Tax=Frankia sp. Cr2 TaxID=3073932 RepID=UPI002AD30A56|nr:acetoacetate decarboxylase family protein [Frankia sp. Cr2]